MVGSLHPALPTCASVTSPGTVRAVHVKLSTSSRGPKWHGGMGKAENL